MSGRSRVVAAAGVLVALFVVGMVWLVTGAVGGSGPESTALEPASSTGAPAATEEPTADEPSSGAAAGTGGGSAGNGGPGQGGGQGGGGQGGGGQAGGGQGGGGQGGGDNPPRPPRTANVAGARLDGNLDGTCVLVSYPDVAVQVSIEDIAVKSDAPGLARDDQRGCSGPRDVPLCQGFAFTPDAQACNVGLAIPDGTPPGTYTAVVQLALRVRCTSTAPAVCKDVGLPAPTAAQPVDARFPAEGPPVDITVDAPESTSEAPAPTEEPTTDATESPTAESTT
ncbi:MAG: hypothetical protein ACJ73E_17025 [Mycobacteriales bacterium]